MTDTLTALPDAASTSSATNPGITADATPGITANADSTVSPVPASVPAPAPATATTDDLIQEGQRLGGPLGGAILSMTAAAAKHVDEHGTPQTSTQSNAANSSDSELTYHHDYQHDANGNVVHVPTPKAAQTAAPSAPAPRDPQQVIKDPKFLALPAEDQQSVLSHIDPKFAALPAEDQQSVIAHLQSLPKTAPIKDTSTISAAPAPSLVSFKPSDIIAGPEGGIGGSPIGNPVHVDTSAIENYTPEGRTEHPLLATLGDLTKGVKELLYGGKEAGKPMGTSSGVLNNPVTAAMSLAPGAAETGAAAEGLVSDALAARKVANAAKVAKSAAPIARSILPEDLIEREFAEIPQGATPQHGTPVETPQPLDRATVDRLSGGKNLSTEAFNTLKQHVGGPDGAEIEVGSSPKNILHKASAPVQKTLTETGLAMNKAIQDAPAFKTSTIADADSTLLKDIEAVRDNLPLKTDDPLNKVVDVQMTAAYPALESTDPAEVLAYRRKLSGQIDWQQITNSPETAGQAKNLAQVKIYNALGNKIHAEIPETVELDKTFQPNLELQSFLDKNGVSRDAVEANAEHLSELTKGKRKLAVDALNEQNKADVAAHNKTVVENHKLLGTNKPMAATTGPIKPALDDAVSQFKVPAEEQDSLQRLLRPNITEGKLYGTNTNWPKALEDFNNLTPEQQAARFKDPEAIRTVLRDQARSQVIKARVAGVAGVAGAYAATDALAKAFGVDVPVLRLLF